MNKNENINTIPISKEATLINMEMLPDEIARQGGLQIGDVLDHMFNSDNPQHVVVDIYDGNDTPGSSYSLARIRIPGVPRKYLATHIRYFDEIGVLTPTQGRIILDPNDEVLKKDMIVCKDSCGGEEWYIFVRLRLPYVSVN
jgi:hypothetical protein